MKSKFRYIGDYPDGKTTLAMFGCVFSPGAEVELPDHFAQKAQNNPFFERVEDTVGDETGDEGPAERTKAELIAEAASLGVEIDKRWSPERIMNAIAAANIQKDTTDAPAD